MSNLDSVLRHRQVYASTQNNTILQYEKLISFFSPFHALKKSVLSCNTFFSKATVFGFISPVLFPVTLYSL